MTASKLTRKLWQSVVFYKRTSICLVGSVIAVALYFFWGEIISVLFVAVVVWVVARIYPSKIRRRDYDKSG